MVRVLINDELVAESIIQQRADRALIAVFRGLTRGTGRTAVGPMNLGQEDDYRIPDAVVLEAPRPPDEVFTASALLVAEVRSPGDETYEKFDFYFRQGVTEIVVALPDTKTVEVWGRELVVPGGRRGWARVVLDRLERGAGVAWRLPTQFFPALGGIGSGEPQRPGARPRWRRCPIATLGGGHDAVGVGTGP